MCTVRSNPGILHPAPALEQVRILLSPGPLSQEEKCFFPSSHSLQHFSSLASSFLYTDPTGERWSFEKLFAVEDVAGRVL